MGKYGVSVTPTLDSRFIDNSALARKYYEMSKTPNLTSKDTKRSRPQIDIVVTSYNADPTSQKSSVSPMANF